ncbi:MAG: N-acetylmuramoyl-L-alanine amidase [Deltaproteobacteria bacterium]|nr:N-acetylmuramoyl-L-alanine amidase [Deltaproteobacteria bacterium]
MKRGQPRAACTILLILCCVVGAPTAHATTIALDVGHSLTKPGATSARGVPEFVFNRALALVLRDELQARGFTVLTIGEKGDVRDLYSRPASAKGADLLLSVHHDSVQPHYLKDWQYSGKRHQMSDRFSGFSLFVSRSNLYPTMSLSCASSIGAALRNAGVHPSAYHAQQIPGENRPFADEINGVHYFDDLVVLKTATLPAVLLEAGVIVNPADELLLSEPATRQKIAAAVASAMSCLTKSAQ